MEVLIPVRSGATTREETLQVSQKLADYLARPGPGNYVEEDDRDLAPNQQGSC